MSSPVANMDHSCTHDHVHAYIDMGERSKERGGGGERSSRQSALALSPLLVFSFTWTKILLHAAMLWRSGRLGSDDVKLAGV